MPSYNGSEVSMKSVGILFLDLFERVKMNKEKFNLFFPTEINIILEMRYERKI